MHRLSRHWFTRYRDTDPTAGGTAHRGCAHRADWGSGSSIILDRCQVTDADVARLTSVLTARAAAASGDGGRGHGPLTLSLEGNALSDNAAADLCAVVKLGGLRELKLGHNKFTEDGIIR